MIVGVLPALKATGRRMQASLQQLSSRGAQQNLGRTWTGLIVFQVAIAVAILPSAVFIAGKFVREGAAPPGYPVEEILRTIVSMEPERVALADTAPGAWERAVAVYMQDRVGELIRRLEREPGVAAVTVASGLPRRERFERIEVEGAGATRPAEAATMSTHFSRVDARFFDVFGVAARAGRTFVDGDAHVGSTAVVVDQPFVDQYLKGGTVLGRRIRLVVPKSDGAPGETETGPWLEIIGVVPDFIVRSNPSGGEPAVYAPMSLADAVPTPLYVAVRVRGASASKFIPRLREVATAVDPALQLRQLRAESDFEREDRQAMLWTAMGIAVVTASVLLLSATGIYAMMSFTVTRRRREIGIRAALGADRRRILAGVFARASTQLGAGVLVGLALSLVVGRVVIEGGSLAGAAEVLLPAVAALMMVIGLLAALGPARRGLAVQPTEALREE
jgi:putative ABC transport system permease protein